MAEDVAMLKEELRMKEKELQELAAEKSKNEAKVKHVLKASHEKIEELKTTVAEKEKEINKIQNIGDASTLDKKSAEYSLYMPLYLSLRIEFMVQQA